MTEYEVLVVSMTPCGGPQHAERKILEVTTDDPMAYVRENSPFPFRRSVRTREGDLVIETGNEKGYQTNYTFTEV